MPVELLTVPSNKLLQMNREELLEALDEQTREEIKRIEFVFSSSKQLRSYRGEIKQTKFDVNTLRLLFDAPFEPTHEMLDEFSYEELLAAHVASDPAMWAKTMLEKRPRAYQTIMLRWPHDQKVFRLGRRLGKTWTLALKALWHAYTHEGSPVLVVAPMKSHVELIYKEMLRFARCNKVVFSSIVRHIQSPQYKIELENGSIISFFTSGIRSGGRADVARGQEAHIIILDEADLLHMDDLNALYAMMQQTSEEYVDKEFWASSTPTGRRELFWEWAHSPEFKEFWFPSLCNPFYSQKTERRFKEMFTNIGYEHEVLAVWGEAAEGVFPPRLIDDCFVESEFLHTSLPMEHGKVTMGVDWDKYGAGCNIVVCDYFPRNHPSAKRQGKARVLARVEIPKGEYTLTHATQKVILWNEVFKPEHIYVDRGYAEMQVEQLLLLGQEKPETGLKTKVTGIAFNENIEVYNVYGKEKKEAKHFMVNCLHRLFEERQILIPAGEEELYKQLTAYMVVRTTQLGKPVFEAVNGEDHILDALMLATLAIAVEFLDWTRPAHEATKFSPLGLDALTNLVRAPKNEAEEEQKEKLSEKGYGFATERSFTPRLKRVSRKPFKRSKF